MRIPIIQKGQDGERIATSFLIEQGHTLLFRNYRTRFGEIDIISFKDGTLFFIEVKHWNLSSGFHPLHAFPKQKKMRMWRVTQQLFQQYPALERCDFSFSLAHINEKREVCFYSDLF
ncbi:YraN family protein [Leptospira ryugenii]|uniref:YraN family protein n=1 Tax=Leptospira ryugenii TaxID=1917863 RepID=UPI001FCF1919|nr:YraN family protein [Leptospira ryugenii]